MILTKTPLRISFVGGGSDRPSFYMGSPGLCVTAAIDKFVYVTVSPKYDGSVHAAYSAIENVATVDALHHDLMREALRMREVPGAIEIHSIADIPGGSGLGSSSSFTVGLLRALGCNTSTDWLARSACEIEIDRCGKPIGKQDQYSAAYGGINLMEFSSRGVAVSPLGCSSRALSDHCLLLDTGTARIGDAGAQLASQQQTHDDVRALAKMAIPFAGALAHSEWRTCGEMMHEAWKIKRRYCSNERLNQLYTAARREGAWGGKLCGAGGGGFLLFLAPPARHTAIATALKLRHVPIRVGVEGCTVVYAS